MEEAKQQLARVMSVDNPRGLTRRQKRMLQSRIAAVKKRKAELDFKMEQLREEQQRKLHGSP